MKDYNESVIFPIKKVLKSRGVEENEPERICAQIFAERQFHNRGPDLARAHCREVDGSWPMDKKIITIIESEVGDQKL